MRTCALTWLVVNGMLLALAPSSYGQAKRAITIDDYFTQADLFGVAYHYNHIAYVEGRWQKSTNDRKTDLWVVPTTTGPARRLTADRANDRSPQWNGAGTFVYFLGNRKRAGESHPPYDGKTQVWRITPDGKASPEAVTRVDGGVAAFQFLNDRVNRENPANRIITAPAIYYLVHVEKIQDDWSGLRSKFSKLEYGHGQNHLSQIWKLDLQSYRSEKLIDAGRNVRDFSVTRDGKRIAMITTPDDKVVSFEGQSRVDVWEGATGKITTVPEEIYRKKMSSPYGWLESIAWNTEGTALAFGVIFDGYPAEIVIADLQKSAMRAFKMPRPGGIHIRGYGSPLRWIDGKNDIAFLADERGRVRLCAVQDVLIGQSPELRVLTPGDVVVEAFDTSFTGSNVGEFAAIIATPTQFADVHFNRTRKSLGGRTYPVGIHQLTNANPQAAAWKLPQLSIVSWKGAGGQTVEGILELPPDYKKGDKVPLVVEIHGGPTTASYFKMQYWIYGRTLLPARGYAVLCPNYRGSTGYGDNFTTDLIGHENNLDVEDILKGVDALVERGIADPDKLAVTGWSNGGYLTNCIITKTNRFKAAISGAGIVDAIMEWGATDEPAYANVFKQGLPWTSPEKYHKASSTYQLGNVRTPTLIHVGGNDQRCPPAQSRMLYRALKEYLKVPTELIVYPGEPHGLTKYSNRRAKMEWDLAWLDRYVMGKKK